MAKIKTKPRVLCITARCVGCQKVSELTPKQIEEGKRDGAAISSCCFMPMVVETAAYERRPETNTDSFKKFINNQNKWRQKQKAGI